MKNLSPPTHDMVVNIMAECVLCTLGDMVVSLQFRENVVAPGISYASPMHTHSSFEVHYIKDGDLDLFLKNKHSYTLQDGSLCVVPPEVSHFCKNHENAVDHVSLFFTINRSENISDSSFSEYVHYANVLNRISEVQMISSLPFLPMMERIREWALHRTAGNEHLLHAYGSVLFLELCSALSSNVSVLQVSDYGGKLFDRTQRKWKIENYIIFNYMADKPIESLMETLHLSRRQTNRIVCQLMGEPPAELITKQRISVAKDLIRNSAMTLEEIAREVGYRSYSGFYNAVRKICGATPEQLAKELRDEK